MMTLIILVLILMDRTVVVEERNINKKTYLVPKYNLFGCEKYMLPKLDNAPVHHTFFSKNDINELYLKKNIDPEELPCNLKV